MKSEIICFKKCLGFLDWGKEKTKRARIRPRKSKPTGTLKRKAAEKERPERNHFLSKARMRPRVAGRIIKISPLAMRPSGRREKRRNRIEANKGAHLFFMSFLVSL